MWNARKIKTPEPFPVLAFFSEDSLNSFLTVEKKSPETTQNSVSRLVMRDAPLFLIATSKLVPFDVALVRFFRIPRSLWSRLTATKPPRRTPRGASKVNPNLRRRPTPNP